MGHDDLDYIYVNGKPKIQLQLKNAAEYTDLSYEVLRRAAQSGKLKAYKLEFNDKWYVFVRDLNEFLGRKAETQKKKPRKPASVVKLELVRRSNTEEK